MKVKGFIAGIVLTIAAVIVFLPGVAKSIVHDLAQRVVTVTSPAPAVVEKLQALSRLETVRQVGEQVVEARSDSLPLPQFLVKDKLLMLVSTEAVAGVDLAKMKPSDVQVSAGTVTVRLPEPEIFSVNIDDTHTKVYSRERGWFVFNPNTELEQKARMKARNDAEQIAMRGDVLTAARKNAEASLRPLIGSMGYKDVRFVWDESKVIGRLP